MLEDIIRHYKKTNEKDQKYTSRRYVYTNESFKHVYVSKGGSVLPNKHALWPEELNNSNESK